jgi:hypothetical protein
MRALYLQGGLVFYFKLYDDKRLKDLKHSKKIEIVNKAVKLYRKDKPLNITSRLMAMLIWCGIPAVVLFFVFNFSSAIAWFALSIFILDIKLANDESADVETYLDQVLE